MTKATIIATNETIRSIVEAEIEKYGINCDLNHIDTSKVTNMEYMFYDSKFSGDISKWTLNLKSIV